ncbi:hypothetical protein T10_5 [Trichinella papuae]|uniref:Uncharacterized protein n=1 Tax=Trichinella papuae TaxID=268474 RepID=A0A0V1MG89_9BILA|nr:hypothetical protein T10_5 [Trichinella papuae]
MKKVGKWGIEVAFLRTLREQRNPSGKEELTLIEFILEMEICHRSAFPMIKKLSSEMFLKSDTYLYENIVKKFSADMDEPMYRLYVLVLNKRIFKFDKPVVTDCPGKCILEQFGNNMCKNCQHCTKPAHGTASSFQSGGAIAQLAGRRQYAWKKDSITIFNFNRLQIGEHHRLDCCHRIGSFKLVANGVYGSLFEIIEKENSLRICRDIQYLSSSDVRFSNGDGGHAEARISCRLSVVGSVTLSVLNVVVVVVESRENFLQVKRVLNSMHVVVYWMDWQNHRAGSRRTFCAFEPW